ncbi:MAG: prepilin-type N-terminal cleavage/methylation domain-containing protein [Candidatus Omnitrophica bacterium]|nr:prepilin-type N-terminal cleavage/methylation domain-containing protein [Candidatus Omnitrophota bacterium]
MGFTMVELLIASAIAGLILTGLLTSLTLGIKAWVRVQKIQQAPAAIALEKWAAQFSSAPSFSGIPFQVEESRIAFPALVNTAAPGEPVAWSLGRVEYFFDSQAHTFCLREQSYGGYQQGSVPIARNLVVGVKQVRLEFLQAKKDETAPPTWSAQWEPDGEKKYPWAVRITLVLDGSTGGEIPVMKTAIHPAQ